MRSLKNGIKHICRFGTNYPPFHPFCRTTTSPVILDLENTEGFKQNEDGKWEYTGGDDFEKWYNKFVEDGERVYNTNRNLKDIATKRQEQLISHPELALPNAENAIIEEKKFSMYIFNAGNEWGYAKGSNFTKVLGYDINNYDLLIDEISKNRFLYPVIHKGSNDYGDSYEQKQVVKGINGRLANVIVAWKVSGEDTYLTTLMIKELRGDE